MPGSDVSLWNKLSISVFVNMFTSSILCLFLPLIKHVVGKKEKDRNNYNFIGYNMKYTFNPISTLPEHLHSTLLSHAKTT